MDRRNRELIGLWAQNPISRRSLLGAVTLSVIASSSIGKALGVTAPVINQILGRPTDSSIAVSVLSSSPISAYIEYGISKTKYTVKSSTLEISPTAPSVFELRGLRSSTKIYYRVRFKTADQKFIHQESNTHSQQPKNQDLLFLFQFTVIHILSVQGKCLMQSCIQLHWQILHRNNLTFIF